MAANKAFYTSHEASNAAEAIGVTTDNGKKSFRRIARDVIGKDAARRVGAKDGAWASTDKANKLLKDARIVALIAAQKAIRPKRASKPRTPTNTSAPTNTAATVDVS
jgi:hypothetical protein